MARIKLPSSKDAFAIEAGPRSARRPRPESRHAKRLERMVEVQTGIDMATELMTGKLLGGVIGGIEKLDRYVKEGDRREELERRIAEAAKARVDGAAAPAEDAEAVEVVEVGTTDLTPGAGVTSAEETVVSLSPDAAAPAESLQIAPEYDPRVGPVTGLTPVVQTAAERAEALALDPDQDGLAPGKISPKALRAIRRLSREADQQIAEEEQALADMKEADLSGVVQSAVGQVMQPMGAEREVKEEADKRAEAARKLKPLRDEMDAIQQELVETITREKRMWEEGIDQSPEQRTRLVRLSGLLKHIQNPANQRAILRKELRGNPQFKQMRDLLGPVSDKYSDLRQLDGEEAALDVELADLREGAPAVAPEESPFDAEGLSPLEQIRRGMIPGGEHGGPSVAGMARPAAARSEDVEEEIVRISAPAADEELMSVDTRTTEERVADAMKSAEEKAAAEKAAEEKAKEESTRAALKVVGDAAAGAVPVGGVSSDAIVEGLKQAFTPDVEGALAAARRAAADLGPPAVQRRAQRDARAAAEEAARAQAVEEEAARAVAETEAAGEAAVGAPFEQTPVGVVEQDARDEIFAMSGAPEQSRAPDAQLNVGGTEQEAKAAGKKSVPASRVRNITKKQADELQEAGVALTRSEQTEDLGYDDVYDKRLRVFAQTMFKDAKESEYTPLPAKLPKSLAGIKHLIKNGNWRPEDIDILYEAAKYSPEAPVAGSLFEWLTGGHMKTFSTSVTQGAKGAKKVKSWQDYYAILKKARDADRKFEADLAKTGAETEKASAQARKADAEADAKRRKSRGGRGGGSGASRRGLISRLGTMAGGIGKRGLSDSQYANYLEYATTQGARENALKTGGQILSALKTAQDSFKGGDVVTYDELVKSAPGIARLLPEKYTALDVDTAINTVDSSLKANKEAQADFKRLSGIRDEHGLSGEAKKAERILRALKGKLQGRQGTVTQRTALARALDEANAAYLAEDWAAFNKALAAIDLK